MDSPVLNVKSEKKLKKISDITLQKKIGKLR